MSPAEGTAARAPAAASRGPSHPPPAGDYPSAGEEGDATAPHRRPGGCRRGGCPSKGRAPMAPRLPSSRWAASQGGGGRKRGPGTKAGLHVDAVPGSTYRHSRDPSSQPPPPPPPEGLHSQWQETHSWMTPLWREAAIHGLTGWKAKPLTRADLDSNLVSMVPGGGGRPGW